MILNTMSCWNAHSRVKGSYGTQLLCLLYITLGVREIADKGRRSREPSDLKMSMILQQSHDSLQLLDHVFYCSALSLSMFAYYL